MIQAEYFMRGERMLEDILFVIIVFVSNIIQTVTGFAGTMLAMPGAMMLIGINDAKAILNVMGLAASIWIGVRNYKNINLKEFMKIVVIMFMGMIIGIYLFNQFQADVLMTIYGVLIMIIAMKNLITDKKVNLPEVLMYLIILLAGVIHGMFVSGGALLVVYAASRFTDKATFRATLAPVWVLLNTYMFVSHISAGYFIPRTMILTVICLVPLAGAIYIGNLLHNRINQKAFMKMTYILLLASGIFLLV